MDEYEMDFGIDELFDAMNSNIKEDITEFSDLVNLDCSVRREIYVSDINGGLGSLVDSMIRFWNHYDNDHDIPVEERTPIKIYIDSCGGSLTDTLTMVDAIKMSDTPIWTIVTGCAYSGGFFTAIAGHRRLAYPHASFLFHEGSAGNSGTSSQFENFSGFYKKQLKQLEDHTLSHTNISKERYDEIHKEDIWMTAEEALEFGVIDEISEGLI